jgi:hypothetical protein
MRENEAKSIAHPLYYVYLLYTATFSETFTAGDVTIVSFYLDFIHCHLKFKVQIRAVLELNFNAFLEIIF